MTTGIQIRKVTAVEEILKMQKLERQIWGMEPIPVHQTITAVKNGGLIVGAFLKERMIGYSYSFAGFTDGQVYLCSHMLAVDREFQLMGIGKQLKDEQLRLAREMGYQLIVWTFDPLESRNAYLNTSKLYGVCYDYIVNCYGEMDDGLNKGLPTDRFQVAWWIDSPRVLDQWQPVNVVYSCPFYTDLHSDSHPVLHMPQSDEWLVADAIEVPVPKHIQLIKNEDPELAYEWRMHTRKVFQQLCAEGFALIDVRRTEESVQYYRFCKRSIIPLQNERSVSNEN
ncbi:GNAT family N-acetyltransferase [Sporosarcina sp. P37]|uniref:GNAT family N-acetyltransferase n=1 Tax=unclassified Sporosarcina TaxID=2647733 RepID=UPI0009BFCA8F|nr:MULTISPECIES: GNAT family N-acetyltransferase [unclassified Sporosarcina]ARD47349.1 GCN5 family acetyltransferase [Sporosarcina sp. P33]ARK23915.1 GNAT family N-acetyltransferase [Sporosarcina sp. P37]PID17715.1 GNAT family N-acetyltransferase [Sporosarcina sp. P35]